MKHMMKTLLALLMALLLTLGTFAAAEEIAEEIPEPETVITADEEAPADEEVTAGEEILATGVDNEVEEAEGVPLDELTMVTEEATAVIDPAMSAAEEETTVSGGEDAAEAFDLAASEAAEVIDSEAAPEPDAGPEAVAVAEAAAETATGTVAATVADDAMPLAEAKTSGKTAISVTWTQVDGAEGYDVFFATAATQPIGDAVHTVQAGSALTYEATGLKKGTVYQAVVKAWQTKDGAKTYVGQPSPTLYVIAGGVSGKWCNAKSVAVKADSLTLAVGQTGKISASAKGVKKGKKVLKKESLLRCYSSDAKVATVSGAGAVTGVGVGTCRITVMANNGLSAAVTVTVSQNPEGIPPTKITFGKLKEKGLRTGCTLNLAERIALAPDNATTVLTWSSSQPDVASVDENGVVTGIKKGKTTVSVVTANGLKAKVKVKVKKNNTIVFFGDSLTRGYNWQSNFKSKKIYNMGIVSNTLRQMTARVDAVAEKQPAKVFILGGINSLMSESWDAALADYKEMLDLVQAKLPKSQVYILSVLPISSEYEKYGCSNADIVRFNESIQALAREKGYEYIDIHQYYVKDGVMNSKLTRDGLHLKKKAYKYWKKAIKSHVNG